MMLISIKQHLINIWSSIHEKVKQRWGWLEKKALVIKKVCILLVPLMKVHLIHFLFRRESEVFLRESWKNQLSSSRFCGFWNCDLRTDLFNGFV